MGFLPVSRVSFELITRLKLFIGYHFVESIVVAYGQYGRRIDNNYILSSWSYSGTHYVTQTCFELTEMFFYQPQYVLKP